MKEQHRFVSRFKIRVCHFSLVGLIILTQIQLGTAQADWADQAFASFKSPLDYPRLADVDRKKTQQDVNQDNKGNKKPTQRPGKFYSNEPRKPKQETGKVYEHRDFKSQEYRDKHRVWSTKDKKRRYRYYRHP